MINARKLKKEARLIDTMKSNVDDLLSNSIDKNQENPYLRIKITKGKYQKNLLKDFGEPSFSFRA